MNRRDFLQFLGVSGVIATLPGCSTSNVVTPSSALPMLNASIEDKLQTISGIDYKILIFLISNLVQNHTLKQL